MTHRRLLLRTVLLASLVSGCTGTVVEGTGAGSSGDASGSSATSSASATTTMPSTPTGTGSTSTSGTSGTSSEPPGSSGETGAPATDTGDTSGGVGAVCGNGEPEFGELCDDGNAEQADGCTTLCRAPQSCLELLGLAADTPDESYAIDPEGDGTTITVYCDMKGGGWTQVYYDEFNEKSGWSAGEITDCGELGKVLGGAGQFGFNQATERQIELLHVPHTQLRLIAELAIIDSWDDEHIFAEVDGQEVAERACKFNDANTCGQTKQQCGGGLWQDGNTTIAGDRDHAPDTALLRFHADLSEDANNEAWGLDTVRVFVK